MKKLVSSVLVALTMLLVLGSCGSTKNVAYFQNADSISLAASRMLYEAKIMPKDELTITVITTDPKAAMPFNLSVSQTLTQVVEGIVVRISIFEYEVADFVAEVIHQPALLDRINLVEGSGDMETDGVLGVALLERCYGIILFLRELSQFLGGEPSLVAASELYLVAVLLGLHATHDRAELREFNLSDAGELVFHLLLLRLDLLFVRPL